MADLNQTVVKWGDKIGTNGNDVISVTQNGTVVLWDNKARTAPVAVVSSSTFTPGSGPLINAIQEAESAIRRSNLPEAIKAQALDNLEKGNFVTNTVGAGSVRNSVQVRFCNGKPC